mmetsp:Transcript_2527/g.6568  ORF Transcript_2527/g.6568 Transcript_2527/m.6568 type:complete len:211 (-) Transcript_2527:52-684(-)
MALRVEPFGPTRRCRLLTKRSFEATRPPIFRMSQYFSSSRIVCACGSGTLRASSLIMSRALMIMYGSQVLRVVFTVIEPSTRFRSALISCSASTFFTSGQTCLRYCSLYCGNSIANELSSVSSPPFGASSLEISTGFQWSMSSVSQGLSRRYLLFLLLAPSAPPSGSGAAADAAPFFSFFFLPAGRSSPPPAASMPHQNAGGRPPRSPDT